LSIKDNVTGFKNSQGAFAYSGPRLDNMEGTPARVGDGVHNANMERTLEELGRMNKEVEDAVNQVCVVAAC
jgi:hypothetical protein